MVLNRALTAAQDAAGLGQSIEGLATVIADTVAAEPRARLMGCDIVWADTFEEASGPLTRRIGIMISAEFGPPDNTVLLIDQREIAT